VSWPEGSVTGLRARGGFEVAMQWKDGRLQSAEISNPAGATCRIRYGARTAEFALKPGERLRLNGDLAAGK